VRGRGVLQAIELSGPDGEPAYGLGGTIQELCLQAGLLFSVRRWGSVLRFTVPLSTTDEQLGKAAEILDDTIGRALAGWQPADRARARAAQV
jgi:4-aminobutyrate aminotransferase-like enzyme